MVRKPFDAALTDFTQSIGLLVRRARTAAASHDLSWTESAVLKNLADDGPLTTADLARAQGMRPQSMRSIVAALDRGGMIKRRPHATDGRQVNLELTAKGAALQKTVGEAKRTWIAHAFRKLNEPERETLFAAAAIIRRMIERDSQ